ncbi:hypothetical protein AAF712_015211 [Marasmius tenuissimus]|uniref:CxC2-like cysteine cluster KDZ transposase-associated domain-containing protein n=1 Tax=Marasmius tenuissimus TaxID=585030 RepID=A0ABR2ZA63_9AGAR
MVSPLHWAEEWNGMYFERKDPSELGLIISLGHNGGRCPAIGHPCSPLTFTIVDCNGIHTAKVEYCQCPNAPNRFQQLLEARLFPASVDKPETTFTFELLKDNHLHGLSSKKTSHDFMYALRMKTDNAFPEYVKNPIHEFNRVARLWRTLLIVKRCGGWHGLDSHFPLRKGGCLAFPCFACPEPGFNVGESWSEEEDVDEEFLHLASAFWSIDGHFGLRRRKRIEDPDDVSLLEGRAMFPKDDWFNGMLAKHGKRSPEKSSCSKFKAVELQNRLKFKGCVISGVVAVQCARHGIFMSATDLSLGETYIHGDLAIAIAMDFVMKESLKRTKFFRRLVMIYDIACQFHVKFRDRIKEYLPELSDTVDYMHWLVGKMHLDGHIRPCKYRFNLNYTRGCGRTDGEGIERTWAEMKQAGGGTQEMNHGNRHDAIVDYWNFWNWLRLVKLAGSLRTKILNARIKLSGKLDYFLRLTVDAGESRVKGWEQLSTTPTYNPITKEVSSVYAYKEALLPSQESILHSLLEREEMGKEAAEEKGPVASFINQGLKLETIQYVPSFSPISLSPDAYGVPRLEIRRLLRAAEISTDELARKREDLRARINLWRTLQLIHMPELQDLLRSLRPVFPEEEQLYLPSFFMDGRYMDTRLSIVEGNLRKGQAYDALTELKFTLKHKTVLVRTKRREAQGTTLNTRAKKFIRHVARNQDVMISKYTKARASLINLKVTDGLDSGDFPPLTKDDLYRPGGNGLDAELGDGSRVAGWIWRRNILGDEDDGSEQVQKAEEELERVPWFRARADVQRWVEEVELLEEEFRRMISGCEKMSVVWESAAKTPGQKNGGYVAYAYQKSVMFDRMSKRARQLFQDEKVGGGWPGEGQTLTEYLRSRRPTLTVDWGKLALQSQDKAKSLKEVPGVKLEEDESSDEGSSYEGSDHE